MVRDAYLNNGQSGFRIGSRSADIFPNKGCRVLQGFPGVDGPKYSATFSCYISEREMPYLEIAFPSSS